MTLPQCAVSNSCWTIWVLLGAAADLRRLAVEHVIILGQALRRVEAAEEVPRLWQAQARVARCGCKLM